MGSLAAHQPQTGSMLDGRIIVRPRGRRSLKHAFIVHWGGTVAGDDPDGKLFAKFRYLLDKRFRRKFGIELTAIWVRERHRNKQTRLTLIAAKQRSKLA